MSQPDPWPSAPRTGQLPPLPPPPQGMWAGGPGLPPGPPWAPPVRRTRAWPVAVPAAVLTVGSVGYVAATYGLGINSRQPSTVRTVVICLLAVVGLGVLAFLVTTMVRSAHPTGARPAGATRALLVLAATVVLAIAGLGTMIESLSMTGRVPQHFRGEASSGGIVLQWDPNRWATGGYEISVDSEQSVDFRPVQGTSFSMPNDSRPHMFYVISLHSPEQGNSFTARLSCPPLGACTPVANPYVTGGVSG